MPNFPDIPGKSLIGGTTKRARVVAAAAAGGALAVGGVVAKRALGHRGSKDDGDQAVVEADDVVVPIAKVKAPPKPKPAKPKVAKPKAASPKPKVPPKPKADKPKPPKPKAAPTVDPDGAPFGEDGPEHPEGGGPPPRGNPDQ